MTLTEALKALKEPDADMTTRKVLTDVWAERVQQDDQWGEQNHPDGTSSAYVPAAVAMQRGNDGLAAQGRITWMDILTEEFYEACAETDPALLREELIQVAAVAVAWVEAIDRRTA